MSDGKGAAIICRTENRGRGRPAKPGRSVPVTVRLREGEDDEVLARLLSLPAGRRSSYIRRVLAGSPVDALDRAFADESASLTAALDSMWTDWEE